MPILPIECSMRRGANILFRMQTKFSKYTSSSKFQLKQVPVIINNFNRLEYLQVLVGWLEKAGLTNIHIIDNQSSYEPLITYYHHTPYTVYRLDRNKGHFALWETILFSRFSDSFYIYTDPDVVPIDECPLDAVEYFYKLLSKYPNVSKVGFGLKLNDLPDHYPLKSKVLDWEKQFWENELEPSIYEALIDTTFALYRPGAKGGADIAAIRTGDKYVARHLPWYEDPTNLSEESAYYLQKANAASSWYQALKGEKNPY